MIKVEIVEDRGVVASSANQTGGARCGVGMPDWYDRLVFRQLYQAITFSGLSNSMTMTRLAKPPPSIALGSPPRTRKRPPNFSTVGSTRVRYASYADGLVTSTSLR